MCPPARCGAEGLPCCGPTGACRGDFLMCSPNNVCMACGKPGQVCCKLDPACVAGSMCGKEGMCIPDTSLPCGGLDQRCCTGGVCVGEGEVQYNMPGYFVGCGAAEG